MSAARRFKPYPVYKDSGVEWLGEIPAHWDVKRLWHLTPADRRIMYGIVLPGPNVDDGVPIVKGGDVSADRLRLDRHRNAEELIQRGESKTLEFKSTLRWNLQEDRQDDKGVTHAVLKTVAAFLNTEGGDLLIGVADNGAIVGIERDQLDSDDKFMRHLAQIVRNALGDRAGTCIDPKTQIVQGKTLCVVSCQRSPEPVFLKWKGLEAEADGDFFVRSGPGTVKLPPESTQEYIRTRFGALGRGKGSDAPGEGAV